jgi:hypothetical protein
VALWAYGDAGCISELRVNCRAAVAGEAASPVAGHSGNNSGRGNPADPLILDIGDKNVARDVDRYAGRADASARTAKTRPLQVQLGARGRPTISRVARPAGTCDPSHDPACVLLEHAIQRSEVYVADCVDREALGEPNRQTRTGSGRLRRSPAGVRRYHVLLGVDRRERSH